LIWFGSSAGVAISKDYPEARNTGRWLKEGWFVAVAYAVAFLVQQAILPWNPHARHGEDAPAVVRPGGAERGGEAPKAPGEAAPPK
jgi:hypothetical protein